MAGRSLRTLRITDLRYAFGDRMALDDVGMEIRPGVITGLLGPNGAGKTTLIRILLGVLPAQHGDIRLDGESLSGGDRSAWGYMPQQRGLYPAMPVGDQVVHFARLHGLSRATATPCGAHPARRARAGGALA